MDLRKLPPVDVMSMVEPVIEVVKGENIPFEKGLKPPYLVAPVSELLAEDPFYSLGICWSLSGIKLFFRMETKFSGSFFPEVEKGDGVEVFIDTRSIATTSGLHKYCHHFVFLPKEVDGIVAAEVTRFKGDDKHDPALCENFSVNSVIKGSRIDMEITIPEISLFGYNPLEVPKMAFACRVHRSNGEAGHFPLSEVDFKLRTSPALWARMRLVE